MSFEIPKPIVVDNKFITNFFVKIAKNHRYRYILDLVDSVETRVGVEKYDPYEEYTGPIVITNIITLKRPLVEDEEHLDEFLKIAFENYSITFNGTEIVYSTQKYNPTEDALHKAEALLAQFASERTDNV